MLRKFFVIPALLSLACLLMLTDAAQAQRKGGGGGGGGGGARGGVNSGRGGSGWYGYVAPYVGGSNYNRGGGWYNSYPGGYRSSYYSPNWYDSYSYPQSSYYAPQYYTPAAEYYTPATEVYVDPVPANSAQIRVTLPDPNARVWFDGNATQQTGTDRLFHTPSLQAGVANTYRIRASWMQGGREVTQERVVNVNPGQRLAVDFSQPISERLPEQQFEQRQPAQAEQLEGRIVRTGQDQFVIETRDKRQVTVFTNGQTRFMLNQTPGAFADMRIGNNVTTGFTVQGDRHIANTVTIRP